jgi:predicted DsbA family dithiol-disulfide isomerase/uncharacterized membrane protein
MAFRKIPRELSLQAVTALSWLGLFICQRVQAGFIDPKQTVCIDGGSGCAKLLHNPKFILLGLHPHEWGALFFVFLILLCLLESFRFMGGKTVRITSLALNLAALAGVLSALASGYAQYRLIHQICPLCFMLDCILLMIAAVILLGEYRLPTSARRSPISAKEDQPNPYLSASPLPRLLLLNLFGFAVIALLSITVKTADRKTYLPHIATVGGEPIFQYELEEEASPDTYPQDILIHQAQKKVLNRMIGEKLLAMAAKKEGQSLTEYLAAKKIPTDGSEASREKVRALIATLRPEFRVKDFLRSPIPPVLEKIPQDGILVGNPNAPLKIVCFTDFECPYCRKLAPVLEAFQSRHPEGVSIVYCQSPLTIHPLALPSAKAAFCAEQQGRFRQYQHLLFSGEKLSLDTIQSAARSCGLDQDSFNRCMSSPEIEAKVQRAIEETDSLGIHGTPRLYFNGQLRSLSPEIEEFEKIYQNLPLEKQKEGTPQGK